MNGQPAKYCTNSQLRLPSTSITPETRQKTLNSHKFFLSFQRLVRCAVKYLSLFSTYFIFLQSRVISADGKRNISMGYFSLFKATTCSNHHRKLSQCYTYISHCSILQKERRNDVTHTFLPFFLPFPTSFFERYFAMPLLWLHLFVPIPRASPAWHFL